MEQRYITTGDGCRIAYRLDGREGRPILMLSNSLGTTMEMWKPQLPAFAENFRVLRYDSRGHGASDAPAGGYSMDRLGRDVVEILDGLGFDKVHFCGLSMGGMVGQWLGFRAPERIDRLILCNTSASMGPPSGWQSRIELVREQGMTAVAQAVIERWFTPTYRARAPDEIAEVCDMLLRTDPLGYAGCCAAIRDMDMRPVLPLVRKAALVIAGLQDPATPPEHADIMMRLLPDASLVTLDAAHLSNIEQPALFADAVLEFVMKSIVC
ncbi:3-oxoadipate enol-lactonase [Sphingopyxis sp.]|jgi:3-oxoadipate enol-lactonase|uniref:3-oxoadipate enol-lactonase n=1 Tax=Sphingopyxis sp. TaxID=1908224 RepID=UPI00260059DF|nr:3-oxoadipate enol-lactonase [Sphingopyxis sp.]MBK6411670.1 3-oxoadipate enol-lactonase [Sphingopyxis sp.]